MTIVFLLFPIKCLQYNLFILFDKNLQEKHEVKLILSMST